MLKPSVSFGSRLFVEVARFSEVDQRLIDAVALARHLDLEGARDGPLALMRDRCRESHGNHATARWFAPWKAAPSEVAGSRMAMAGWRAPGSV
jgi:hypothetical protein